MKESTPDAKSYEPGTIQNPIFDAQLTKEEALRPNPDFPIPPEAFEKLFLLEIMYLSFDGKYHRGQIVIDKELRKDVRDFFDFLLHQNFPINIAIPVAHERFNFNDHVSMAENNSSGFNPRNIAGKNEPSNHAYGWAIDINPRQNPYIKKDSSIEPDGAVYDSNQPGTLTAESPIVKFLKDRGWIWGGDYQEFKDYHHFEKLPEALEEVE